jgi:putative Mg2+ transporter-C (MgtC) family protein
MLAAVVSIASDAGGIPVVPWQEVALRLTVAGVLGAAMGLERQIHGRAAGLRTMMLVALGCCLVMLLSNYFAEIYAGYASGPNSVIRLDPARLAYSVMGGIGFLGAGAILKSGFHIRGLTTAATIWCVAAIGMSVGMGLYFHSLITTALVLFALFVLDRIEDRLESSWYKTVEVHLPDEPGIVEKFAAKMRKYPASVLDVSLERRSDGTVRATYNIRLPDREYTLPFFDAVAREPEVKYIQLR